VGLIREYYGERNKRMARKKNPTMPSSGAATERFMSVPYNTTLYQI